MKNLVCIPSGKNSLHQHWNEIHTDYGFDLCLLQWDNTIFSDKNSLAAKYKIKHTNPQQNGVRFKMLYNFVKNNDIQNYDRLFWIDDDIETTPKEIAKFFSVCEEFNFDLAQPSLTPDSKHTYPITLTNKKTNFRLTNTVEIMMPCFSTRALSSVIDLFENSKYGYGWGMELMWDKRLNTGNGISVFGGLIGIIDECQFKHGRDLGSNGLYFLGPPYEEIENYEKIYNVNWKKEYKFINYAGIVR